MKGNDMAAEQEPLAVHFGAGCIGRGFLGQLLFEGGCRTTFIDIDDALAAALDDRRKYPLRLVSPEGTQSLVISNIRALSASDTESVIQALLEADLISTAVGVAALPEAAPVLAAGIAARAAAGRGPINILLCENQWRVGALMQELLRPYIPADAQSYFETQVGLTETVIGRMVPKPDPETRAEDPLLMIAEPYMHLPVSAFSLRGPLPPLPGLLLTDNFQAYAARKLLLHNMSHAALAYLGYQRGHQYIWQCVGDEEIAAVCLRASEDVCQALSAEYGFEEGELAAFMEDLMTRFTCRALGDSVVRVAADPLRKLRLEDRLIGAAAFCLKHSILPWALCQVIEAALAYDNPTDPAAVRLQEMRKAQGDQAVLETVCGLSRKSPLGQMVMEAPSLAGAFIVP